MDIAFESRRRDGDPEPLAEIVVEGVEEVPGLLVTAVDQRVLAVDRLHAGVAHTERGEVGVVLPKMRARGPDVGEELPGIAEVQVADSSRQHDNVARRLEIAEDQLAHAEVMRLVSVPADSENAQAGYV